MTQLLLHLHRVVDWLFAGDEPPTIILLAAGLVMILACARLAAWRNKRAAGRRQWEPSTNHKYDVGVETSTSATGARLDASEDDQQTDSGRVA